MLPRATLKPSGGTGYASRFSTGPMGSAAVRLGTAPPRPAGTCGAGAPAEGAPPPWPWRMLAGTARAADRTRSSDTRIRIQDPLSDRAGVTRSLLGFLVARFRRHRRPAALEVRACRHDHQIAGRIE